MRKGETAMRRVLEEIDEPLPELRHPLLRQGVPKTRLGNAQNAEPSFKGSEGGATPHARRCFADRRRRRREDEVITACRLDDVPQGGEERTDDGP